MKMKCVVYDFSGVDINLGSVDPLLFPPYGYVVGVLNDGKDIPGGEVERATNVLIRSANVTLADGVKYEIRKGAHYNFCRESGMAWISTNEMQNIEWQDTGVPFIDRGIGCYIIRRLCASKKHS